MPFFPLNKIRAEAASRAVYLRGVHGYNAGWIRAFTESSNAFYPCYVTASGEEADGTYFHVEIGFDGLEELEYFECCCEQFHPREGACRHIVAALVHKYYQDMVAQLPTAAMLERGEAGRPTDPAARQRIDRYMAEETRRLEQTGETGTVVLTPLLSLEAGQPVLRFTVGTERPYLVRNLARFVDSMEREETSVYGKQLTLRHHPDSFVPASRPLLDFLLAEWGDRTAPVGIGVSAAGELALSPAGFDRFYALTEGQTLLLRTAAGDRSVRTAAGDPCLTVTVSRQRGGMRLGCEAVQAALGLHTLYVLQEDCLYRTGREYSDRMTGFVQVMRRAPEGIFISQAELPAFCAGVWKTIEGYIRPEGDVEALAAYRPRKLEPRIYLDAPEPGCITARVEYHYGEETVLPFAGAAAPRQPWQDPLGEERVKAAVMGQFTSLQPQTGLLVLRGEDERLFTFLTEGVQQLRRVAAVYASDRCQRISPTAPVRLQVGVSLLGDLLQVELESADWEPADLTGIMEGYRRHETYHRLQDGRFVALDDPALAGLAEITDGLAITDREWRSGRITLPRYRALYLDAVLQEREGIYLQRDAALRELLSRSRTAAENDYPIPESLRTVLRPYQQHGYRWLRTMEELGFGGILADEMGLGKTVQVIALLLAARESGADKRPSLVVCPTSLVLAWEREIQRFAPALRALCVLGDATARQTLIRQAEDYDVLLTSYDMLKRDVEQYRGISFHYHILDEAQYIKNSNTQNAKAVKAIHSSQRFALTGTPVENRLSELWSIFDFLTPGLLFRYTRFRERFETPIVRQGDERVLTRLSRMTAPFILRRLKREVLTELPDKTERLLPATMEDAQRQVYRDTLQTLRRQLEDSRGKDFSGKNRMTALALLTRLRQICCDPRLCCEGYTGESCKLEACVELLQEAAAGGHKVLLFSQFTSMLALIRQRLEEEHIGCYVLQGSTPKEQRAALVDAFNTDATPVFLISLKAGGTGLNLTGADMVIHYAPWWNLSAQNQATDRAHRIGQKNPVQVVRLVVRDTVEEKILQMQEDKWRLAEAVVGADGPSIASLSAEELLTLLAD